MGKEFGGPLGAAAMVAGLPAVCVGLYATCSGGACAALAPPAVPFALPPAWVSLAGAGVWLSWLLAVLGLHLGLPGRNVQGVRLAGGGQLQYKMNALAVYGVALGSLFVLSFGLGALDIGWAADHFFEVQTASIAFSLLLSLGLYLKSHAPGAVLAEHGNTGNALEDFFMGRELNPRIGRLDLKEFCELYPGLIGWAGLNLAMAYRQYTQLGRVTNSMVLVNVFQALYVADALWYEPAILSTMDITTDGFGFMLAFGDLTWVPFTYTLQARYLVDHPQDLSPGYLAFVVALKVLGYAIFRGANGDKDKFRREPDHPRARRLKYMNTERGTKLIISGWWGLARHINYTGDWLMGLAWCLPCGITHVVPYFYAIYFACLLIHRDMRDNAACRLKYGRDWDKYCAHVPYRLVPYVY